MSLIILLLLIAAVGFYFARRKAWEIAGDNPASLHSRPVHHGMFVGMLALFPAAALWILWQVFDGPILGSVVRSAVSPDIAAQGPEYVGFFMNDVVRLAMGLPSNTELTPELQASADYYRTLHSAGQILSAILATLLCALAGYWGFQKTARDFRARNTVESWVQAALFTAAAISVLTTAGIVFSVLFESIRFFQRVPITEFLFGLEWSPQTALRADQVGSSGAFGAIPLFAGTLLITVIAMLVAGPIGMLSAIFLAEYSSNAFRSWIKPIMEILAGIPTVVYGFFAALTVAPNIRRAGEALGLTVSSESALAAGLVMGIMIIPFVSSLSDDAIKAVPQAMRDASLGLGATRAETIRRVIIPAALPGIIAGFLLAVSRAIGETMIVVMAAGLAANLTANPFEAVTTVTVQIVTLLVGDQEFDSAKTLSAFALGLVLFVITLSLNVFALHVMRKYREQYD
jgi:phosphate transport system permease protein